MEQSYYEWMLRLGTLDIRFVSEVPLQLTERMRNFSVKTENADITVKVKVMRKPFNLPLKKVGEDLLLEYYYDNGYFLAAARPGTRAPASVTLYKADFTDVTFYINEEDFPEVMHRMDKILQLFPIRQLLPVYRMAVLHSSRVEIDRKALVFTAPSGMGKTTQAKLWKNHVGGKIVSNDRTLIQKNGEIFFTCGYPVDGREPVCSSKRIPLGTVIVLRQGSENRAERLLAGKALKYLMEQTVADGWNWEELDAIRTLWMDLIEQYPIYLLTCTPDSRAVFCLKEQLEKDGVISNGDDQRSTL